MRNTKPEVTWLTVNRKCNFRCRWCYAEGTEYNPSSEMSLEMAKRLTIISKEIGIRNILIIGGEPTLWKHIFEFNEFCLEEGLRSVLITNGLQFGSDRFWQKYKKSPSHNIGLSLKASNSKQLQEVTGVENFSVVKKGITRALTQLDAQVSITYNKFYTESLVDMVQFAIDCGAETVKIDFCSTTFVGGKAMGTYMVDPRELARNIMRDYPHLERATSGHIVFELMLPFCLWPLEFIEELKNKGQIMSVCHVHKRKGFIFSEAGELIACNALFDYPIGKLDNDFSDGKSLLHWLNTSRIIGYYNSIRCYPSLDCESCRWYSDCGGGCPLRWALYEPEEIINIQNIQKKGGDQ